jgi:PKD repeat protein
MTHQWSFGDGNTSSATNPTNLYAAGGNYTVTLNVITDKGCVNTNTSSVIVFGKPTVTFIAKEACAGSNAVFTNTTTGTNTYTWDFGDASATSNVTSPTHTYTNAGIYTVKLTANNASNCTDVLSKQLTIYANPVANFNVTDRCIGQSNNFVNTSTGANDVFWQFGDGNSSNSFNPSYTYSTAGTYNVILSVKSKDGCTASITKTANSFAKPKAGFSVNDDGQCINVNNFAFTDNSSIGSGTFTRSWTFGDGGSSSNINPAKTYSGSGNYAIKLVLNSTNGCKDSATSLVMVYPKPTANFTINNPTQCLNGNLFFFADASTIANGSMNRVWDIGDNNIYGGVSALKNYQAVGTYRIKLGVSSDYGCSDTISKTVTVNASPSASFTINDEIQCLNGNNFAFTNTTLGAGGYTNSWKLGDGATASSLNASRSYASAGNFKVSLKVTTPFNCFDSAYYFMVVKANPANLVITGPINAGNGTVQVYSVPANVGSSYNWVATNGVVASNGSNLIQVKWNATGATGSLVVTETATNECVGAPASLNVALTLVSGISNLNRNAFAANLYPNPNTDQFTVEVSTGDMVTMNVFDQLGRKVIEAKRFSSKLTIENHNLAAGIYTVKLETDKGKTTILRFEVKH